MEIDSIFKNEIAIVFLLSFLTFCISMLLTPIYTYFAFKFKLWKQPRTHSVTGDALSVISKLRIKRTIPRMAGLITIVSVSIVTLMFNLDREQTWLPLAALVGAGGIGFVDDGAAETAQRCPESKACEICPPGVSDNMPCAGAKPKLARTFSWLSGNNRNTTHWSHFSVSAVTATTNSSSVSKSSVSSARRPTSATTRCCCSRA